MKPTAFKIACVLGILLLACAIALLIINPQPQHNLPKEFFTPIIAFEFIRTPQEVKHFFEVKNIPCYEQKMLLGNWIDYGFMFLYSGLLFCIISGIKKITQMNVLYIAMLLCVVMLVGDALENFQIYQIIEKYKISDITNNLSCLNIFTWSKWSAIASCFLLISPFFLAGNLFQKLIGILCIICFGLCIAAFLHHGILNEIFALNVVAVFLLLVIFVFTYKEDKTLIYTE
ncbi:MAG: hypothetical protein JWN78_1083 [Bacteroidota bacterium]|nr:hypothetical protein [Bacteroidota bacterium]